MMLKKRICALHWHMDDGFLSLVQCRCWIGLHLPSKRAIPRQNRSDRSQDRRESVPSQSVDCCITVLSGWTDDATIVDDVIACPVPKRFFRPINARELWLLRGFSCVSGNRVDMDTLPEARASTWHDFCIIWGVHNRDTCWVIRGCRAKKTDSKTGHGS